MLNSIDHIYFCTGARNEKLLSFFDEEKVTFEIDERIGSFKALGRAKLTKKPVAICTTSGTAVSECLSALLEAQYSNVPLILISGDRPKKLHGTGSPQTINHQILTSFLQENFYECTLEEFAEFKLPQCCAPIHLNVLVDDTVSHENQIFFRSELKAFRDFLKDKKNPLFLFSHEENSMRKFVEKFKALGLPFFAETLSGGKELSPLKAEQFPDFDSVIRVGHTPLSKIWRQLEKNPKPVFSFDNRNLPALSFGEVLSLSSDHLYECDEFWSILDNHPFHYPEYLPKKNIFQILKRFPYSEPSVLAMIQEMIPQKAKVYLGNSLVIRFFELVQEKTFELFGSRGVNGIDGQLATAIGMAESTSENVYCILGDLTTLYDVSSLSRFPKNLKLMIINNGGGKIFEMLKLDPKIILSHEKNFSKICRGYNVSYSNSIFDVFTHQVVEFFPDQEETRDFLQEWNS